MVTQRYTPHPITLLTWESRREIAIPEIQRPFVWEASKCVTCSIALPRLSGRLPDHLAQPTVKLRDSTP